MLFAEFEELLRLDLTRLDDWVNRYKLDLAASGASGGWDMARYK